MATGRRDSILEEEDGEMYVPGVKRARGPLGQHVDVEILKEVFGSRRRKQSTPSKVPGKSRLSLVWTMFLFYISLVSGFGRSTGRIIHEGAGLDPDNYLVSFCLV
jgi:hypothetical protein